MCACGSLQIEERTYEPPDNRPATPYYYIPAPGKTVDHTVIIIPDLWDSVDFRQSALVKKLHQKRAEILIVGKAGGDDIYKRRSFDNKQGRISDLIHLINHHMSDTLNGSPGDLNLIGFGEGGYLLPDLCLNLRPDKFIAINAGAYSLLQEFIFIINEDSLATPLQNFFKINGVIDSDDLIRRVKLVHNYPDDRNDLGINSNNYWHSYFQSPAIARLASNRPCFGHYILSSEYPYISKQTREFMGFAFPSIGKIHPVIHNVNGKGNFNNAEEMEELSGLIVDSLLTSY